MTAHTPPPVLFTSLSHPGMFYPTAGIVGELARRGVEGLWFGSTDDRKAEIEALSRRSEVRFVSLGPYLPQLQPGRWSDDVLHALNARSRLRAFAALMDRDVFGKANSDVPEVREANFYQRALDALDHVQPGLVVIDTSNMWMFDAVDARNLPYVVNSPTVVSYMYPKPFSWTYPCSFSGLPHPMTLRQKLVNAAFSIGRFGVFLAPQRAKAAKDFARTRRELGIANATNNMAKRGDAAESIIGHSLFGVEFPFEWAPKNLHMIGTVLPAPSEDWPTSEIAAWLDAHPSVLYFSLGTMSRPSREQIAALVDAAGRLAGRHHVLWSLPESQRHLLPDGLPANVRIERWVPQAEVLAHPHVRAFLSHGGNGAHQGLHFGKPLLLLTHLWEVRDNAVRFVGGGSALQVDDPWDVDPAEVADKLHRLVTEPRFGERARYWQERYHEAGGASAAAEIVLRHRDALTGAAR
ncbi:glycosyltransferase [Amycolatopsis sp. CA-230715]|uniref:glycosyltransferase n=1 Tax=Amycolatopsis sp. CA-230715 TaxID=2745196 RepID=UPI001C0156F5|nr:glycosyltransferase [Amycolatopsis sp. CA-230715]QWF84531.1 hypothetical protein HUW46_07981 [Amycolatopsis sp. CA-230715]